MTGPDSTPGDHPPSGPHLDPRAPRGDGAPGPVVLPGAALTVGDVEAVARHGASAALDVHARARMDEARAVIEALVAEGRCRPVMDSTFPLDEVVEAHRRMDGGRHIGKIVLIP